jgi:hypothetical protein
MQKQNHEGNLNDYNALEHPSWPFSWLQVPQQILLGDSLLSSVKVFISNENPCALAIYNQ